MVAEAPGSPCLGWRRQPNTSLTLTLFFSDTVMMQLIQPVGRVAFGS